MITLYILVSKSVKAVSEWKKLLPEEEALWLIPGSSAQLVCVPGHSHISASQGCSCSGVVQKGICVQGLGLLPFPSCLRDSFTFWKWSINLERGRGQRCWGVCCVTSVVTGCNTWQEGSLLPQLCSILTKDREYRIVL